MSIRGMYTVKDYVDAYNKGGGTFRGAAKILKCSPNAVYLKFLKHQNEIVIHDNKRYAELKGV